MLAYWPKGQKTFRHISNFCKRANFLTVTKEGTLGRRLLEEVIALDPQFAPALQCAGFGSPSRCGVVK